MSQSPTQGVVRRTAATVVALVACLLGCTQGAAPPVAARAAASPPPVADAAVGHDSADRDADDATPARDEAPAGEATADEAAREESTLAAPLGEARPQVRQAAKPVVGEYAANVPPVLLSAAHAKLSRVNVGDVIPTIELPMLGGGNATLESLAGEKATVVLFWTADRWMSATALSDLARLAGAGTSVVGIAVGVKPDSVQQAIGKSGATISQLIDEQGTALAQVGEGALPRILVLDGQRRIAWFDIEYSEATRRELLQTIAALTGAAR